MTNALFIANAVLRKGSRSSFVHRVFIFRIHLRFLFATSLPVEMLVGSVILSQAYQQLT